MSDRKKRIAVRMAELEAESGAKKPKKRTSSALRRKQRRPRRLVVETR